jgi:hypothetical protein
MGLYWLFSAQGKIQGVKRQVRESQRALLAYDGEFQGAVALSGRLLSHSLRHLGWVLWPALLASLPVLSVIVWLNTAYGHHFPEPGAPVEICARLASVRVQETEQPDCRSVRWPGAAEQVTLRGSAGEPWFNLPLAAPVPVVHKKQWWNVLIGNPAGYLPSEARVEEVTIGLPEQELLAFGPSWMQYWIFPFFCILIVVSLIVKTLCKIH